MVKFYAVEFIRNFGRIAYNVLRLCVRAGFLALTLIRSRKLKFSTNVHTKHVTPPDAKPLLAVRCFCLF